jgi:hypothetical protein
MDEFTKEVMEYESDTFSASEYEITEEEAAEVSKRILRNMWDNRIDGLFIAEELEELREEREDEEEQK